MANILLVMDDLDTCNDRLLKRAKFTEKEQIGIVDYQAEWYIIMGLRRFDDNVISKSLKFHVVETDTDDSILEVQEDLMEYLIENFPIKKPL